MNGSPSWERKLQHARCLDYNLKTILQYVAILTLIFCYNEDDAKSTGRFIRALRKWHISLHNPMDEKKSAYFRYFINAAYYYFYVIFCFMLCAVLYAAVDYMVVTTTKLTKII